MDNAGQVPEALEEDAALTPSLPARQPPPVWRPSRESAAIAALLSALAMPLFAPALLRGRILFERDLSTSWLPQVETFVQCVAHGALPLWNPYGGFGRPLLADARTAFLYPPTWLNLILPPSVAILVLSLGHLVLASLGGYWLARRLGVRRAGALAAAGLWLLTGPLPSLVSQWHNLAAVAWLPWVLLTADIALTRRGIPSLVPWTATMVLQTLAGGPDYSAFTMVALLLYLALGLDWHIRPEEWRRRLWRCVAVGLVAAALTAPQWLVSLDAARSSGRAALDRDVRTSWSLHPSTLAETLLPMRWAQLPPDVTSRLPVERQRFPLLASVYLGLPCLLLALAGATAGTRQRWFLVALGLAALGYALGRYAPFYDLAVAVLPPLKMLRFPVKAMVVCSFALSQLAGMGWDALYDDRLRSGGRRLWLGAALLVAVGAGSGIVLLRLGHISTVSPPSLGGTAYASARVALLGSLALTSAVAIWASSWPWIMALSRWRRAWPLVLATALGVPLAADGHLIPTAPRELWTLRPPVVSQLERTPQARIYSHDYAPKLRHRTMPGDLEETTEQVRIPPGWDLQSAIMLGHMLSLGPATPARWRVRASFEFDVAGFDSHGAWLLDALVRDREGGPTFLRLLQMGAVTHVLARIPAPWWDDLEPVGTYATPFVRPTTLLRVPDPLPLAYAVDGVRVAPDPRAVQILEQEDFDPRREILLPEGRPQVAGPGSVGTATIIESRPDSVRVRAHIERPGFVVLVEQYDPGWKATLDGRPTRIQRANIAFRAIAVPAGEHVIEMRYRPRSFIVGCRLALACVVGLVVAAGALTVRRRRRTDVGAGSDG